MRTALHELNRRDRQVRSEVGESPGLQVSSRILRLP